MTNRLYYSDSHLTVFEATVIAVTDRVSGWAGVTLDQTAFYPTGGGQPSDVGHMNSARVVECVDQEEKGILHIVEGEVPRPGDVVKGRVDWPVRLDHLQQHTGQHILSQAFVALYGAETKGFRMLTDASEIDLALDNPTEGKIHAAVELANEVIWADKAVSIHNVTPEEASSMPLRKDSAREGVLRVIEIEDFDLSPCGGTHAQRTGEVGIICVRSWERAKGMIRVLFVAGGRALTDYDKANATARSVAGMFSAARDDAPNLVAKMTEENKQLQRRVTALEVIAAKVEAEELLAAAVESDGVRIVSHIFNDRDANSLKRLALAIASNPNVVVFLGSKDAETARIVFAKSADAPGDMNALLKEACNSLEGKGGGKPDFAQGGGKRVDKLEEVVKTTGLSLRKS